MFILDTDVISALRKQDRNPEVVGWVRGQQATALHLSVITLGEIERGIARQRQRDPVFGRELASWLDQVLSSYSDRIIPINLATALRWGRLSAALGHSGPDLLIAATALEHGLAVVTRNVRHFEPTGVRVVNPFA